MSTSDLHTRLRGLHEDKVALITGGSVGIGAALGRMLAISGAKVMLAARSAGPLDELRQRIVAELAELGYGDPAGRVAIEAHCDVGNPVDMERLAWRTLATFGHVDYLINNAGVVGTEDMVIDMPIDGWRQCLQANMNSNYALIRLLAPQMKARGAGYVINVSSYFGGEKYVAIAYPNRADYAVSKAGQRAMVETLARFLGPEIQINAVSPGPVDGDRLRGTADRPSMFQRRARVILENRRLGEVYAALIHASRESGALVGDLLPTVLANDVQAAHADKALPAPLRRLAATILTNSDPAGSSRAHFLSERLARKLIRRLTHGGHLSLDKGAGGQGARGTRGRGDEGTRGQEAAGEQIPLPPLPFSPLPPPLRPSPSSPRPSTSARGARSGSVFWGCCTCGGCRATMMWRSRRSTTWPTAT